MIGRRSREQFRPLTLSPVPSPLLVVGVQMRRSLKFGRIFQRDCADCSKFAGQIRVLVVQYPLETLPPEIAKFSELRSLNLSNTWLEILPPEINISFI